MLAVDGTTVQVPSSPQLIGEFGKHSEIKGGTKNCLTQVLLIYDVLSDFVISSYIGKMKPGERGIYRTLLPSVKIPNALFLMDRGFGCFEVCKSILSKGNRFCIRFSDSNSTFARKIMLMEGNDFVIDWYPSRRENKSCIIHGHDQDFIKVRVTKVLLNSGEVELLVSNLLDFKQVTEMEIGKLYYKRWGVEEGIKS